MVPARPLHEIFADLTGVGGTYGDAGAALRAGGHADLPEELLTQAVVSYAETASAEVAEHLAPFVMGHSVVFDGEAAGEGGGSPLDLLASAPAPVPDDPQGASTPEIDPPAELARGFGAGHSEPGAGGGTGAAPVDAAFGQGDRPEPPTVTGPDPAELDSGLVAPGEADPPLDFPGDPPLDFPGDPWAVQLVSGPDGRDDGEPAELDEPGEG